MYLDISELIGQTITSVKKVNEDEGLIFETKEGNTYKMYHMQDCCEYVYLEDIVGELNDITGSPIVTAEEVTNSDKGPLCDYEESYTWTFYHLTNQKGYDLTLRWYGSSNGYYSESVDFVQINE